MGGLVRNASLGAAGCQPWDRSVCGIRSRRSGRAAPSGGAERELLVRRLSPEAGRGIAVSAAEGRTGAAAIWIRCAWALLPMEGSRRLIASATLLRQAGLLGDGVGDRRFAVAPLDDGLGPADRQIMLRVMAGEVAALVVFPNAHVTGASRDRLLILLEVAVRAGLPVAFGSAAASRLIRHLAEEATIATPPITMQQGKASHPNAER